jgi:hypothetical protein
MNYEKKIKNNCLIKIFKKIKLKKKSGYTAIHFFRLYYRRVIIISILYNTDNIQKLFF